jgi:DNA-binding Xre family transcriptional regulator
MSRIFLFDSLRAHLKARGITYKQLAQGLDLSEQTIKRIFASNDCSVERMEQMCRFLQLELTDLVKATPKKHKLIEQLSTTQESELVEDKKLLMVAICVMALWTIEDMLTHLSIPKSECLGLMHRLEKIGFIELHPGYHYRLLIARHFSWIVGGPIMQLMKGSAQEFFSYSFEEPGEILKITNVRISAQARETLKARLEQVTQEYADQVVADSYLSLDERPPLSICIAVRTWVPEFLQGFLHAKSPTPLPTKQRLKRNSA